MAVKSWSSICNIGLATAGPIDVARFRAVFRVTNNVARYVANFTPPTDRFPAA